MDNDIENESDNHNNDREHDDSTTMISGLDAPRCSPISFRPWASNLPRRVAQGANNFLHVQRICKVNRFETCSIGSLNGSGSKRCFFNYP